jgi:hypothetical protein
LISPDAENGKAVYAALAQFGAPIEGLSAKDFTEPDSFFRIGTPPVMVDILSRIGGVEFESAWQRKVDVQIDDTLMVPFISRDDLLAAKISAGRAQDLADVAELRESREQSEIDQPAMGGYEGIQRAQARGREEWLEFRRKQAEKTAGATPESSREHDVTRDSEKGIDDDIEL